MEPMTLGSPTSSPAGNSPYLPAFLMGDLQTPITPNTRSNTLSPNKGGKSLTFANSPNASSPGDFNRSTFAQKTLFSGAGGFQRLSPALTPGNATQHQQQQQQQTHESTAGPPTRGLFDTLRNERNQVQTPTQQQYHTPNAVAHGTSYNESFLSSGGDTSFNALRVLSPANNNAKPMQTAYMVNSSRTTPTASTMQQKQRCSEFWVTVFGFPPNAVSMVLQHFSQCGMILQKVFPSQGGNWVHLKYSSRIECDRALNYNEAILNNNIMIGVVSCKNLDINLLENQNRPELMQSPPGAGRLRALSINDYNSSINSDVYANDTAKPSNGLINKAMDLFFGW